MAGQSGAYFNAGAVVPVQARFWNGGVRVKAAGDGFVGDSVELYLCNDHPGEASAYERLLGDALDGETLLVGCPPPSDKEGFFYVAFTPRLIEESR